MRILVQEGSTFHPATYLQTEKNGLVRVRFDGAASSTLVQPTQIHRTPNPKPKPPPKGIPTSLPPVSPPLLTLEGEEVRRTALKPPSNADILSVLLDHPVGYLQGKGFFFVSPRREILFDSSGKPRFLGKTVLDVVEKKQANLSSRNRNLFDGRLGDYLVEHPDVLDEIRERLAASAPRTQNPGCRCTKKDVQEALVASKRRRNPPLYEGDTLERRLEREASAFGYAPNKEKQFLPDLEALVEDWDERTHRHPPSPRLNRIHLVNGDPCVIVVAGQGTLAKYNATYRLLPLDEISLPWGVTHRDSLENQGIRKAKLSFFRDPRYPSTLLSVLGLDSSALEELLQNAANIAASFLPEVQLTDASSAKIGPPVVDLHGLGIAGLARGLALKMLAHSSDPSLQEKWGAYQARLRSRLGVFGFHASALARFEKTGQALDLVVVRCLCTDALEEASSSAALATSRIVNPQFHYPVLGYRAKKEGFGKSYDLAWLAADVNLQTNHISPLPKDQDGFVQKTKKGDNLLAGLTVAGHPKEVNQKLYRASNLLSMALGDLLRKGGVSLVEDLLYRLRGAALSTETTVDAVDALIEEILQASVSSGLPSPSSAPPLLAHPSESSLPSSEETAPLLGLSPSPPSPPKKGRPSKTKEKPSKDAPPKESIKKTSSKKKVEQKIIEGQATLGSLLEKTPTLPAEVATPLEVLAVSTEKLLEAAPSHNLPPAVVEKVAESAVLLDQAAASLAAGDTQTAEAQIAEVSVQLSDASTEAASEGVKPSVVSHIAAVAQEAVDAEKVIQKTTETDVSASLPPMRYTPVPSGEPVLTQDEIEEKMVLGEKASVQLAPKKSFVVSKPSSLKERFKAGAALKL